MGAPLRLLPWLLAVLGLASCLARPFMEPVGGFELVASPPRTDWEELEPRALEALLSGARTRIARVQDYTAVLETRERIEGALYPRRVMELRVRQEPFQVAIDVLEPPGEAGRKVWYEPAARRGQLLLEQPGVLGSLLGRLTLDPRGELAMENRRRPITDLGLVEVLVPGEAPDPALCQRFGLEHGLLVYYGSAQLYPDGPALVEEYLYRDLALDLGQTPDSLRP